MFASEGRCRHRGPGAQVPVELGERRVVIGGVGMTFGGECLKRASASCIGSVAKGMESMRSDGRWW